MTGPHRSDAEADYDDGRSAGGLARFLVSDSVTNVLFLLMLSGCCILAPVAGFLAGLGLLYGRSAEARFNSIDLLVAAIGYGVVLWYVTLEALFL